MAHTESGTGTLLRLDPSTRTRRGGTVLLGGAPWGVVRVGPAVADLVRRLDRADGRPVRTGSPREAAAAARLVARGLAHPVAVPRREAAGDDRVTDVEVVVPVLARADLLDACLAALGTVPVLVVDDGSPPEQARAIAAVVRRHGARLVRHGVNRGPAAARNTGTAHTTAPVLAFVDADCRVPPGWLDRLLPLFDDPQVAAVAPRIVPAATGPGVLARHERTRSALDLGPFPGLVRPGARLGFVPSATLLLRRDALRDLPGHPGFDERLRLGEDVDLVWRLADTGRQVRYEPAVRVRHVPRSRWRAWTRRRYEYGTSAADLDRRHPGRLAPVRPSAWNLATLLALALGRPRTAAGAAATATVLLAGRLHRCGVGAGPAASVVVTGTLADAAATGHALRREWWPLGWLLLAGAPRHRAARLAAACMLAPVALEWLRDRPAVDPVRYAALRLVEDAAYGSGVIAAAVRGRRPGVLLPRVRLPRVVPAAQRFTPARSRTGRGRIRIPRFRVGAGRSGGGPR